jgi:shikimate kinase
MGAGKTTVGEALAERLGWDFIDLDDQIVAREGKSIAQLFEQRGEAAFRVIEARELARVANSARAVIALGGGAFAQGNNAELLCDSVTVFLDAPVEELIARCAPVQRVRPLARDENQFRHLYEARRPHYMKASLRVDATQPVAAIVQAILSALRLRDQEQR